MKNKKTYSFNSLIAYLISYDFTPTPSDNDSVVFFNKRRGQYLKLSVHSVAFSKQEIMSLFEKYQEAMDLPAKIEWCRYKLYQHNS